MNACHCKTPIGCAGCAVCQSSDIIVLNSFADGADGTVARDKCNSVNRGGVNDGNVQLPIFTGDVVDINNSPDIVKPKLS